MWRRQPSRTWRRQPSCPAGCTQPGASSSDVTMATLVPRDDGDPCSPPAPHKRRHRTNGSFELATRRPRRNPDAPGQQGPLGALQIGSFARARHASPVSQIGLASFLSASSSECHLVEQEPAGSGHALRRGRCAGRSWPAIRRPSHERERATSPKRRTCRAMPSHTGAIPGI